MRAAKVIVAAVTGGLLSLGGCGDGCCAPDLAATPDFGTSGGPVSMKAYVTALCAAGPRFVEVFRTADVSRKSAANVKAMAGSTPQDVFAPYDQALDRITEDAGVIRTALSEVGYPNTADGQVVARRVRELLGIQPLVDDLTADLRALPREDSGRIVSTAGKRMDTFRKEILVRFNAYSSLGQRDDYFAEALQTCGLGSAADLPRL